MSETASKISFYRQGSWMVIATCVSGMLMFSVHLFGGWMSREEYGLFVTLLQILNLMMIPALGLQTMFAQQTAAVASRQQQADLAISIRSVLLICLGVWATIAMGAALYRAGIIELLKITNPVALWVTIALGLPQLWLPVLLGILQGCQNFAWLGGAAVANGLGRFAAVGVIVALLGGQAAGATCGVLIGLTTACIIAGWHGRQTWLGQEVKSQGQFDTKSWLTRIVPLTLGLGAGQFMLSADMIAARTILPVADSGPYGFAGMIGRGLVIFTAPLAAVMFPKLVREATSSGVLSQACLGTASLGALTCIGCTIAALLIPNIAGDLPGLAARADILAEVAPLIPYFTWSMLPLSLANVFVAALLARERYRAVPWLVGVAVAYGLALAWLSNDASHSSQKTIILTLGGFNLVYLGTAVYFARHYTTSPESR
ncbi:MAG: hypothetical protein VX704_07375 [Verrucomicrobiota bacterium]|nr:hypothetical protein [Verrucomicrobiota bacterium]